MQQTDEKCQERHLPGYMGGRRQREWVKFEFYCLPGFSNIDAKILKNEPFCFIWRENSEGPSIAVSILQDWRAVAKKRGENY